MSDSRQLQGQCLCGSVTIKAEVSSNEVGACHCSMCRRWSGGPFLAIECDDKVTVDGEDKVAIYASSDWAQRGFCQQCGTHLYYRLISNQHHFIPVGLFQGDTPFHLEHQIFIDEKPAYYDFSNSTRNLTGAELFAQFSQENNDSQS